MPTTSPRLTARRCLATAARLCRSAEATAHPAARVGLAALALDWVHLARRLEPQAA